MLTFFNDYGFLLPGEVNIDLWKNPSSLKNIFLKDVFLIQEETLKISIDLNIFVVVQIISFNKKIMLCNHFTSLS